MVAGAAIRALGGNADQTPYSTILVPRRTQRPLRWPDGAPPSNRVPSIAHSAALPPFPPPAAVVSPPIGSPDVPGSSRPAGSAAPRAAAVTPDGAAAGVG